VSCSVVPLRAVHATQVPSCVLQTDQLSRIKLLRYPCDACLATTHFAIVELARLMASVWKKLLMLLLNGTESAWLEPSLSATNACNRRRPMQHCKHSPSTDPTVHSC